MFSVFRNNLVVKNLKNVTNISELILLNQKNKIKYDFTDITILDSCPKLASLLINKNGFPYVEKINLFSDGLRKKDFNKLLFNQNKKINLHIEFGNGSYLYKNESFYQKNNKSIFFLTKEESEKIRSGFEKQHFTHINDLFLYKMNSYVKNKIDYYNQWI